MKKDPRNAVLGMVVLAVVLGLGAWRLLAPLATAKHCDLSSQVCTVTLKDSGSLKTRELQDRTVQIELVPRRPAPGQELRLIVTPADESFPGLATEGLTVFFSMPGMDMGKHVMALGGTDHGTLEGRIILPFCPLGQSLWQASIQIGQRPAATLVLHMGNAP